MINPMKLSKSVIAILALSIGAISIADHHDETIQLTSISSIHSTNFGIDQSEIEDIKRAMQAAVDEEFLPGALLLVGNSEGIGLLETVGMEGPESSTPINKDTIFRIYSMTKPIISVAIMTMVEDGMINLNDPLEKYIPEFANLQVINRESGESRPAESSITIENLLTHESGIIQAIFSPGSDLGKMYANELQGDLTAQEFAARLGQLPVYFEPGTAWHYGHSTDVLGAVLEVAGGKSLDLVLAERIFEPLGMDETSFWVPVSKKYRIAEPIHGVMGDNTVPRKMLSGGGGLNSTTEDYVRFAEMLLNGGVLNGVRILSEASVDLMSKNHLSDEILSDGAAFGLKGVGMGLTVGTIMDPGLAGTYSVKGEFFWGGAASTIFWVDRKNNVTATMMTQYMPSDKYPLREELKTLLYSSLSN